MYTLGLIASQVVRNADKVLCLVGQFFCFLGMLPWQLAIVRLSQFCLYMELVATI
jgi:hypothetical protein